MEVKTMLLLKRPGMQHHVRDGAFATVVTSVAIGASEAPNFTPTARDDVLT
jgi:hypothetical protein